MLVFSIMTRDTNVRLIVICQCRANWYMSRGKWTTLFRNKITRYEQERQGEICALPLMAENLARPQEVLSHDRTDIRVAILHEIFTMQTTHLFPTSSRDGACERLWPTLASEGDAEVLRGNEARGATAMRASVGKHRVAWCKDGQTGMGFCVCGEIAEAEGGNAGDTASAIVSEGEVGDGAVDGGHV